jgi:DNA-binding response OmpR family regulator
VEPAAVWRFFFEDDDLMDTVLVVEDSRPMQRTLQRLFESDGLQVHIASDGVAGLESFRKDVPNVVVLDLKLPRLPGKELCRAFKTEAASVPVVVLSANADVEDKVLLLELGADDYVTKPFSPKELLARVRRAMRRKGANSQAARKSLRNLPSTSYCSSTISEPTLRAWRSRERESGSR